MLRKLLNLILIGAASIIFASLLVRPAQAASFSVNTTADTHDAVAGNGVCADNGGACSLRAAMEEANALAGADTINVAAGTYTLGSHLPAYTQAANLSILGTNAATTIIDGAGSYGMLVASPNSEASLFSIKNLTLRNAAYLSTAIRIGCISAAIENVVIDGSKGFGIKLEHSFCNGNISSSIKNVLVTNAQGGTCADDGCSGGIAVFGSSDYVVTAALENISVVNNTATSGDYFVGIELYGSMNATITNATVAQNQAASTMAGVYIGSVQTGTINLVNTTIANNTSSGPTVGFFNSTAAGLESTNNIQVNVKNTLLAGNTQNNAVANCGLTSAIVSQGGNLSNDTTCTSLLSQPSDLNNINPLLGTLTSFDSFNHVYTLLPGSPAINAGVDADGLTADQRGVSRIAGEFDIGAYEYVATANGSSGGTSASPGVSRLPTVGVTILIPIGLAFITTMSYVLFDWRRHLRPLREQNPHVHYTLSHHIAVVTLPAAKYRLQTFYPQKPKTTA